MSSLVQVLAALLLCQVSITSDTVTRGCKGLEL